MSALRPVVRQALTTNIRPAGFELVSPPVKEFLGQATESSWKEFVSKVEHVCESGRCQHALKPKCNCGCGGVGHRTAMLREYHSIEEWLEEDFASSSIPVGVYV